MLRALIIKDRKILLVNGDAGQSFWNLPGGRMDYGEDLKSALKREIYEETGLTIEIGNALCVSEFFDDASEFHVVNVFCFCNMLEENLPTEWVDRGGVVVDRKFFSLEELKGINAFPRWLRDGEWLNPPQISIYRGQSKKE